MKEEEQVLNLRVRQKHGQVPSRSRPSDTKQSVLESLCVDKEKPWKLLPPQEPDKKKDSRALRV